MPRAFYFGCWDGPGHYLHDADGRHIWGKDRPKGFPWTDGLMDAGLLRNGGIADKPTGRVHWTCGGHGADIWFAFFWWDRSVDRRGACNSGFYVQVFSIWDKQKAFEFACETFPTIVSRQQFPLVLQDK